METTSTRHCCRLQTWLNSTQTSELEAPLASVAFNDDPLSLRSREIVEEFFREMATSFREMSSTINEVATSVDQHSALELSSERGKKLSGFVQYFVDCCIDRIGSPLDDLEPREYLGWSIPLYTRDFLQSLPVANVTTELAMKGARMSCFNCGGPHAVTECDEPKDFQRIAASRNKFMEKKSSASAETPARYHKTSQSSRFVPGMLSPDLRKALGIDEERPTLPSFIYKMREVGYPPGYFSEQEENKDEGTRTLIVYGEPGTEPETSHPYSSDLNDDDDDDGVHTFEYPGFNSPVPRGVEDRSSLPIRSFDMRHVESSLEQRRNRKRKRNLSETPDESRKRPRRIIPTSYSAERRQTLEDGQLPDDSKSPSPTVTETSKPVSVDDVANGGGSNEYCPKNNWSLDFPPGHVDVSDDARGGHWAIIRDILKSKQVKL